MKKRLSRLLTALLLLVCLSAVLAVGAAAADWTLQGYTPISSQSELDSLLRSNPSGKYYLTQDITLDSTFTGNLPAFSGVLDGNGHTISGLTQSGSWSPNSKVSATKSVGGLFESNSGIIRNLTIYRASISVTLNRFSTSYPGTIHYGVLVGTNTGTIENCVLDSTCSVTVGLKCT